MPAPELPSDLPFTGERFVPGARGEIWVEHWHRYHFATRLAAGQRVVDAACGEGYGSALLATVAAQVTGADISAQAIAHAKAAYGAVPNLAFVEAPCTKLPVADGSADLFVSFETIEHIAEHEAFLDEIARVLAPGGLLLLSCPNKAEYSDRRGFANEFHVKELYRGELESLLARRFRHRRWHGQRPSFFSVIAPEPKSEAGHLIETSEAAPALGESALAEPLYYLVAASQSAAAVHLPPATLSVLADRDDWVHRDYEKVMRMLEESAAHGQRLQAALDDANARATQAAHERDGAREELGRASARAREEVAALHAAHAEALAAKDREILRRRGLRWWLRLPFVRLGLIDE